LAGGRVRRIARIDPATGQLLSEFDAGRLPADIVAAFDSLWIIDAYGEGTLVRMDSANGRLLAMFPGVNHVSAGETAMWLEEGESDAGAPVHRVDPATNEISIIPVEPTLLPISVVQGEGQARLTAWEARPVSPTVGPVPPGTWSPGMYGVRPIDPETGGPLGPAVRVCGSPGRPLIAYGALWYPCASKIWHLPLVRDPEAAGTLVSDEWIP
jgi:hypothetical protein